MAVISREEAPTALPAPRPVRWARILLLTLPLVVANTGWIANSEMCTGITEITISSLFIGITFVLFLLTVLNLAVRRTFGARAALSQAELIVMYILLSMSSVVAGVGNYGFLLAVMSAPFWRATRTNGWVAWQHLLPSWFGPRDQAVLRPFFEGRAHAFTPQFLFAWAGPLAIWGAFFLLLLWTLLCVSALLRRRWAEEEHLPFPIIVLPLEMTREGAPLYQNKLLWAGFAIPCALHSLNSLQFIFPTLPYWHLNTVHDAVPDYQLPKPWTGMDALFYMLHGSGVGFGYLINTDVSFSLWFFYLVKKAANVWGVAQGWRDPLRGWWGDSVSQFPYTGAQGWGAWLALGLAALWNGRGYYRQTLRRALHGDPAQEDAGELMSARTAVVGACIGFLAMCLFIWTSGGSWWVPVLFLAIFVLIMVALTRIRAEAAVPSTELGWINPQAMMPELLGTSTFSHLDLAHIATLSTWSMDMRAAPMPHELEGQVALLRAGGRLRPLLPALLLAALVAIVSASLWDLQMYYAQGAGTGDVNPWRTLGKGEEPWWTLTHWLNSPAPPNIASWIAAATGFGMTFLLSALRARFVGFPLHPAGYVLNTSFANDFFWCDMFVAWAIKTCILRYGGSVLYLRALPFFLGLILGDFVTGSAWSIVGTLLNVNLFRTFAS